MVELMIVEHLSGLPIMLGAALLMPTKMLVYTIARFFVGHASLMLPSTTVLRKY